MEEIDIPEGVIVDVQDMKVVVKGVKGTVEKDFDDPRFSSDVKIEKKGKNIIVENKSEKKKSRAFAGSVGAHIRNMVKGVTEGYKYTMKIVYTHFPMNATTAKNEVHIKNYLGEKGARIAKIQGSARVHIDKEEIVVTGHDIESVGQTAANIERACKLRGRDRRIFQDGIFITHKTTEAGEKIRR